MGPVESPGALLGGSLRSSSFTQSSRPALTMELNPALGWGMKPERGFHPRASLTPAMPPMGTATTSLEQNSPLVPLTLHITPYREKAGCCPPAFTAATAPAQPSQSTTGKTSENHPFLGKNPLIGESAAREQQQLPAIPALAERILPPCGEDAPAPAQVKHCKPLLRSFLCWKTNCPQL